MKKIQTYNFFEIEKSTLPNIQYRSDVLFSNITILNLLCGENENV